jgi:hypothetical protein
VDHGSVKELGVLFSLLQPLHARILFPKSFLLLVSFFELLI